MLQKIADILEEKTASVTISSSVRGSYGEYTDYLATLTTVDDVKGIGLLATGTSSFSVGDCLNNLLDEVEDIYGDGN